jgi:hypothetical protein
MHTDPTGDEFACPVCRARQSFRAECRRCGADLLLYVKALRSVVQSRQQLGLARDSGNGKMEGQVLVYMRWLGEVRSR